MWFTLGSMEESFFFQNIRGRTRFEDNTATVPLQRRQKCLLVFLNSYREVRKRTKIPLLHFTREYSGYRISTRNRDTNLLTSSSKDKQEVCRRG